MRLSVSIFAKFDAFHQFQVAMAVVINSAIIASAHLLLPKRISKVRLKYIIDIQYPNALQ
jgi:hypothetical protein